MDNSLTVTDQAANETIVEQLPLLKDLTLHEDDLTEEAKSQFSYHTDILCAFELYRRSILDNELLTPVGRHLIFSEIDQLHTHSKQVLNYMAAHGEPLRQILPQIGPLTICGLPRTGSTLLHNLLACDPNSRTPLLIEMRVDPVPPVPRSNSVERERRAEKGRMAKQLRDQLIGRPSALSGSHPTFPIEQDFYIMQQAGIVPRWVYLCPLRQTEINTWFYDKANKSFAYDYHETFLRMLSSFDVPCSHWLLKSGAHILFIDTLISRYPGIALIMTHRRLDQVLPSFCRLSWEFVSSYLDEKDSTSRDTVKKRALQQIDIMIKRIIEFRTRPNQLRTPIFDVVYDHLIEQPIPTVRRIYDHFGLSWSHEFEVAMAAWLNNNPQGKQGRNTYSLAEYGLVREDIEERYADYINLFLRSTGSSKSVEGTATPTTY